MAKKAYSWIILLFLCPILLSGFQKSKKAYELIYEDVQILKVKILELEKQAIKNQEDIISIKKRLDEIFELMNLIRNEQASLGEEQEKIPVQYRVLLEKFDSLTSRLAEISEDLIEIKQWTASIPEGTEGTMLDEGIDESGQESTSGEMQTTAQESPPKTQLDPNLSPQEVYNLARSDYLRGNFQLAIEGFTIYLEHFPESPLADNALYWIGECYFSQENYEEAIKKFNVLILSYPEGDEIPAAHLKKGMCLMETGKDEEALAVFKLLISKFPLEEETRIAQEKIKEIQSRISQ